MATTEPHRPAPLDFVALASAPMETLLAELERAANQPEREGHWSLVPDPATQVADFVLAETVRLIRLGTRVEIHDAAKALSAAMLGPLAAVLRDRFEDAYAVLNSAAMALDEAVSPASKGGELGVLRSWSNNAFDALERVASAPGQAVPRAELRSELGVSESYLSHMLAEMEAAGLVERVRDGRNVIVHIGPRAAAEHVRVLIGPDAGAARVVRREVLRVCDEIESGAVCQPPVHEGMRDLREKLVSIADRASRWRAVPVDTVASERGVYCSIEVSVTWQDGRFRPARKQLLLRAHVEGERIVEAELFAHPVDWQSLPPRRASEAAPSSTELLPAGTASRGMESLTSRSLDASPLVRGLARSTKYKILVGATLSPSWDPQQLPSGGWLGELPDLSEDAEQSPGVPLELLRSLPT